MQETQETGFDPWVEKIPGEGNGNPVQYSCLENPMDRGARWVTVCGIMKRQTQLSYYAHPAFRGLLGRPEPQLVPSVQHTDMCYL